MRHALLSIFAALLLTSCGPTPSVDYDGPYASEVRDAIARIERVTGVRFKEPPRVATRQRSELREIFEKEFEDKGGRNIEFEQSALQVLGLIPKSVDLRSLLLDLLVEQVMGFYLPSDSTLYLIDDAPNQVREFLILHELVHALQNQYLDLDSIQRIQGDDDRRYAAQAMLEGQATFVSFSGIGQFASIEQQRAAIRRSQDQMPEFASAPLFLQEMLIFPYLSGNEFVRQYFEHLPPESLLVASAIPTSTEQILHWDRYAPERDAPTLITLPAPRIGTTVYNSNLGEFGTRLLLFVQSREQGTSLSGAQGWDGDRYMVVRTPQGDGIVWVTIWDSTVEAADFDSAMRRAIARRYYDPTGRRQADGSTTFETDDRSLRLWGGEIGGRHAVMYVDMPKGLRTDVIDVGRVVLEER